MKVKNFKEFINESVKPNSSHLSKMAKKDLNKNSTSEDLVQWVMDQYHEFGWEEGLTKKDVEELIYELKKMGYRKIGTVEEFEEDLEDNWGESLYESFWVDFGSGEGMNGGQYLNLRGVPGSRRKLQKLQKLLNDNNNVITDDIINWFKKSLSPKVLKSISTTSLPKDLFKLQQISGWAALYVWLRQNIGKTINGNLSY